MQLRLVVDIAPHIVVPYRDKHAYYLLLAEPACAGTTLDIVSDESLLSLSLFCSVGRVVGPQDGKPKGYIFYSSYPTVCYGSGVLFHSRQWTDSVRRGRFGQKPFGVELAAKTQDVVIYHRKNYLTLVVAPQLHPSIRANLEV